MASLGNNQGRAACATVSHLRPIKWDIHCAMTQFRIFDTSRYSVHFQHLTNLFIRRSTTC